MKNYIRITSEIDVAVSAGLQSINMTNKDAHVADRLNVKSAWVGTRILIKKGTGYYPAEIGQWGAVKSLAKDKVLTIGEEVDEIADDPEAAAEAAKEKTKLNNEIKKYKKLKKETEGDPQATNIEESELKY